MQDKNLWKFVYHLINVILIPLIGIISVLWTFPIAMDPQIEALLVKISIIFFYIGCIWVIVSGVIHHTIRAFFQDVFREFTKELNENGVIAGLGTFAIFSQFGCCSGCLALILCSVFSLLAFAFVGLTIAKVLFIGLAVFLFVTSVKALITMEY